MMNSDLLIPMNLRSGLTISLPQSQAIDQVLNALLEKCPAQFILLVELSGQLICVQGQKGKTDLVALGALIAGDLAASQEIARITDQYQHTQLILREGPKTTTFISEAGQHMALYMRISKEVPIGWARLLMQQASRALAEVLATPARDLEKLDLGLSEEKLNTLIEDGLDSIWNG
jgi:predicted regulator of Ras-like GTPase activity (Roadblock/LC7/MglB family)